LDVGRSTFDVRRSVQGAGQVSRLHPQKLSRTRHVFLLAHSRLRENVNVIEYFTHLSILAGAANDREDEFAKFSRESGDSCGRFSRERLSI
jgi:hypothetical protein